MFINTHMIDYYQLPEATTAEYWRARALGPDRLVTNPGSTAPEPQKLQSEQITIPLCLSFLIYKTEAIIEIVKINEFIHVKCLK